MYAISLAVLLTPYLRCSLHIGLAKEYQVNSFIRTELGKTSCIIVSPRMWLAPGQAPPVDLADESDCPVEGNEEAMSAVRGTLHGLFSCAVNVLEFNVNV